MDYTHDKNKTSNIYKIWLYEQNDTKIDERKSNNASENIFSSPFKKIVFRWLVDW